MIITSIERHKKNKDKLLVYIDNSYSFSIQEEDYLRLNLHDKCEITQDEIRNIKNNINFKNAKSTAVKYLALRLRSGWEVAMKLAAEGYDSEVVERVVEELRSIGYINDKIYAQKYIFDRSKLKPKSKKMLKLELEQKGVSSGIIEEVLSDWEIDEVSVAEGLIRRKFGKYNLKDEKVFKKIQAFLHHRGFSFEVIDAAVKNSYGEI
ncbi:MAG: recombination regulator RecX [Clostridia bacterium]|nr:recombination regulator RecX [Clostridia bacterium]